MASLVERCRQLRLDVNTLSAAISSVRRFYSTSGETQKMPQMAGSAAQSRVRPRPPHHVMLAIARVTQDDIREHAASAVLAQGNQLQAPLLRLLTEECCDYPSYAAR
jgi:hypothetical protein